MSFAGTLQVTTPSDREIRLTRVFNARRHLVFAAYTRPDLVRRWLGVMEGWSMAECEIDLRIGGEYRYLWRGPGGIEMGMRGHFLEIDPPGRIATTEKYDEAWYEGEATGTVTMDEADGRTTLTMLLRYDSREIRDAVLASPMKEGMAAGYGNLDGVLASMPA